MDRSIPEFGGHFPSRAASVVLARTHDAVLLLDGRHRVRAANGRFWAWTSLEPSAVLGRDAGGLWDDGPAWADGLTGLGLGGGGRAAEVLELKTRDGDLIPVEVQLTTVPGRWARRSSTVLVLHDLRPLRMVEKLVLEDPLTGVPSRPSVLSRLGEEVVRARQFGMPLGVVLLDIDRFQGLNGRWGPEFGDQVLRVVGSSLREAAGPSDLLGRLGGGEFLLALPRTALGPSVAAAERLRSGLEGRLFRPQDTEVQVTASFGVTVADPRGHDTLATVLARTGEALAEAKARGRNRVEAV